MKGTPALAAAYRDSFVVQKAHSRRALVLDKDGTISSGGVPTEAELASRKQIRKIGANCVEIASTFRTIELGMTPSTYAHSVRYGLNRPPPQWRLSDGTRTDKLDQVRDFDHLLDFDAFNSAGIGVAVRKNGGYVMDEDYDVALGGPTWRPNTLAMLDRLYPDQSIRRHLAAIEDEENYLQGLADVWPLPYRIQLDFQGIEGYKKKEEFALKVMADELRGGSAKDVVLVDESNPAKDRYTTYLMPKFGTKERSLERLLSQISYHASIPLKDFEVVIAGDTLTDLRCGLFAAQAAKEVTFILAGGSRLTESLRKNLPSFAGIPLVWDRQQTGLSTRHKPTEVPGVYRYQANRLLRPRRVILADDAPWSKGLVGAESVLACLEELGW